MLRLIMMCVLAASIVVGALLATQDEFSKRREQSNAGRQAGLTVAAWAIMESPIIGYGSWPMDARLVNFYEQKIEETGKPEWQRNINVFISHSQVLQGWVEGGVLGVLFWLYYGYWLVRSGWYVALQRPADTHLPIYLFFLVYDFWHLVMSPFAGATRFLIAVGVAIICVCAAERRPAHV
jgi:O-antigen ligase